MAKKKKKRKDKNILYRKLDLRIFYLRSQNLKNYLHNSGFCFVLYKSASVFIPKNIQKHVRCSSSVDILWNRAEHRIFFHCKGHATECKERRDWVLPAKHCPLALILNSPGIWESKLWPLVTLGNISHNPWLINIDIWEKTRAEKKKRVLPPKKVVSKLICSYIF